MQCKRFFGWAGSLKLMNKQKKSMDQNPGQLINLLIKIKTQLLLQKMCPVLLHLLKTRSGI